MPPKRKLATKSVPEVPKVKTIKADEEEVIEVTTDKTANKGKKKNEIEGSVKPKGKQVKANDKTTEAPKEPVKRSKRQPAKSAKKEAETSEDEEEEDADVPEKKPRATRGKQEVASKPLLNQTHTKYDDISFPCDKSNKLGKKSNFCISNWNVDGLRAWTKKDGLLYLEHEKPDVFCIQESKCSTEKLPSEIKNLQGYKQYWHNSAKEGYAGVGLFTLVEPISVSYGIGNKEQDEEGRCITAEFEHFYIISVYVPNAGRKLVTLPKRLEWNTIFKQYIKELDKKKPVVICGDLNVAHNEIDLKNPKTNTKSAGFTKEEREGMTDFLKDGYVDIFRFFYPDKKDAYTYWSYMGKARVKNVGWRVDYFLVSERLLDSICDNVIRSEVFGSDHCPISLFLNV